MIEQIQIFTPSGAVLFKHQARRVPEAVINNFISNTFISQRETLVGINNADNEDDAEDQDSLVKTYTGDGYTLKYIKTNVPSLVFVLSFPAIMHLHNTETLLLKLKTLFVEMFEDEVTDNVANNALTLIDFESEEFLKFEKFFDIQLQQYSQSQKENKVETEKEEIATPIAKSAQKKQVAPKASNSKKSRKWGADGSFVEDNGVDISDKSLDFSTADSTVDQKRDLAKVVGDRSTFGNQTKSGNFLVSDLGEEMDKILANSNKGKKEPQQHEAQSLGFLRNFIGGKKLTKDVVHQTTQALVNHLIQKNVAPEVARNLISNVEKSLVGSTTKSFTSIDQTCKDALKDALTTLLTPNTSIDLLNEIESKRAANQPYVISVVGVNGVGKSTNLSKLAFWLLQNNYRVLITACDTFRSGAVEQLRVHVNNLKQLTADSELQSVELFEGGYGGADLVAKIAKGAIKHAQENGFDIVLMDTAGRRHNDTKLMAPLANFAKAANPDKIIMVGEALVGTDSVAQAQNFNKAFGANRKLDCFIISKCDTVGDLIGSMVNMVYATGIPILFVGIGQTYTDLRTLSVDWAVNMLMS